MREYVGISGLFTGEIAMERQTVTGKLSTTLGGKMKGAMIAHTIIDNRSAATSFRCLAAMPPEGCTRAGILPGCPSLDNGSREAEAEFEPRTFRSVNHNTVMITCMLIKFSNIRELPLVMWPNRKAAVLNWKCKCITISKEQVAIHVSTPNLDGQETVFVRPLTIDQPVHLQCCIHALIYQLAPPMRSYLSHLPESSQNNRLVVFVWTALTPRGRSHSVVKKDAYIIAEAVRRWRRHRVKHFELTVGQRSTTSMHDETQKGKAKSGKTEPCGIEPAVLIELPTYPVKMNSFVIPYAVLFTQQVQYEEPLAPKTFHLLLTILKTTRISQLGQFISYKLCIKGTPVEVTTFSVTRGWEVVEWTVKH
ncbi:hypothetical protein T265_03265 [Opisthorchis viverrini]|uniref:Uncharacterized protein n=1 Tax=Opisthorchis viverrini TaxID=6198 RepID=A0A075A421_OPIVI|nr:hypothetical protein T265_03265 [Opisthorchis viverrini]KER30320.1 hypothetical protein T265_03265 [Opisthorchis viverrini]